ncbi:hypothetical protein AB0O34_06245 [Sphaerisporangium sp. NPDC088356]|uniref:hypothetical protein n=1 Tax=Sphaerisporangium sp. NPDC088356 TaxID=3154871 RepID=UPI0034397006
MPAATMLSERFQHAGDVGLIGFDDFGAGPPRSPPTVIDPPVVEQGALTVRLLLRRHTDDAARSVLLDTKLIERAWMTLARGRPAGRPRHRRPGTTTVWDRNGS